MDAKFDLSVSWSEHVDNNGKRDGLIVSFESGIGPWPGLEDRFLKILNSMVDGRELVSLLDREKSQVLEWAKGDSQPIREGCLHELFERQARTQPDGIALLDKCGDANMTYGELDRRSDEFAVKLQSHGAKPNKFVGLLMSDKSFDLCVGVLGILKSGAAYVPMDPVRFPRERIKFMMEDADMTILVTVRAHMVDVEGLCKDRMSVICVDDNIDEYCVGRKPVRASIATDRAYMIYTSGTTGQPKGVICNHVGPLNMISLDWFQWNESPLSNIVGCSCPIVFDAFGHGFFGALGAGVTLSLDLKNCTVLNCTPSMAPLLLIDDSNNNVLSLITGGETCPRGLEKDVSIFRNCYGPTEASILCTFSHSPSTIGRPLPNVLCYVVHPDDGSLCPPGVSGELWIGGVGVSLGYNNRPELTAEKFIPDTFRTDSSSPGDVYKTGDRVKWNDDGELVFLGRFDHQVKVNGYRIELGEIQAELEKQAGVSGAVAMVHKEKLIAYVMAAEEAIAVSEESLKCALESDNCQLASYMIPWRIIVMDEFPLTVNGKIDRTNLPTSDLLPGCYDTVAPGSHTETFICKLFEEILSLDSVSMDYNFTDLGGHSLLVMKAVLRIREQYQLEAFSVRKFVALGNARQIAYFINACNVQMSKDKVCVDPLAVEDNHYPAGINQGYCRARFAWFTKILSVSVVLLTLWVSLLPSICIISYALESRFSDESINDDRTGAYVFYITMILISFMVLFICIACCSLVFCKALHNSLTVHQTIIRQNSFQYVYWYVFDRLWFVTCSIFGYILGGSIFFPSFYKLFGSDVGKNNFFEDVYLRLPFMMTTGYNVIVESGAMIETLRFSRNGDVCIGPIILGNNVVVGPNTHIGLGSTLGCSVVVTALSVVPVECKVPMNTTILGNGQMICDEVQELKDSEAIAISDTDILTISGDFGYNKEAQETQQCNDKAIEDKDSSAILHLAYLAIVQIPMILYMVCTIVSYVVLVYLSNDNDYFTVLSLFLLCSPIISALGQAFTAISILLIRRNFNGSKAESQSTKLYSKQFLRRWGAAKLFQHVANLDEGSIVSRCARRIMGEAIDVNCSFTPYIEEPRLTKIGKNVFGANGVKLRNSCYYPGGIVRFGRVDIDDSSMLLDRSVVEIGAKIESNVLVASLTSVAENTTVPNGSLFLGNPAMQLIKNGNAGDDEMEQIQGEPLIQTLLHFFLTKNYELLFVSIPVLASFYSTAYAFWFAQLSDYSIFISAGISLATLHIAIVSLVVWLLFISLGTKWLLIGNFKSFSGRKMACVGSWVFFRWELANHCVHSSCILPLQLVNEFWLTALFWKMMGTRIGKRSLIDPDVLLFEADFVEIGDDCRVEGEVTLLGHKFSNGGLEFGPIKIPSKTIIGARAVVLPGCKIVDENVELMPLTHVLPSEELTAGTWHGSPAEKVDSERGTC